MNCNIMDMDHVMDNVWNCMDMNHVMDCNILVQENPNYYSRVHIMK